MSKIRPTHTFAVLKVSQSAYDEIREKLQTAAYDHAFHENGVIDMHGIALQTDNPVIGKASIFKPSGSDGFKVNVVPSLCVWCGKAYDEHANEMDSSGFVPRMPCAGLKSGFSAAG